MQPLVSIIIVNWNGKGFLKECFDSLEKNTYKNIEIIFVDNGSSDDSLEYVKKNYAKVKVIETGKNLGFAGGNNVGFSHAKGKLIMLLNNDTILEKDLLERMVSAMESEKNIGEITPQIAMYPSKDLIDSIGSFFVPSGVLYHFGWGKKRGNAEYEKAMDVFSAKAACVILRRDVLEKTGLFDDDYFSYLEDTDLSQRIWLAGFRVSYIPGAVIYHKGAGTAKKLSGELVQFHSFKNRILTYLKNLSLGNLLITLPQLILIYEITFFLFLLTGKFRVAFAIQGSILWNIINLPKTLAKRRVIQNKMRKIKDSDYLPKVTKSVKPSYYYYMFKGLDGYKD